MEDEVALGLYSVGDNVGKVLSTVRGHTGSQNLLFLLLILGT